MLVEFIGAPGSGKSTLIDELTDRSTKIYRPDYRRRFLNHASPKFTLPYRLLPSRVVARFDSLVCGYYSRLSLYEFIREHPRFLSVVNNCADETERPFQLLECCLRGAERNQMGRSTTTEDEVLVLDENLHHFGANMMTEARQDTDMSRFADYFDAIPTPDLLVHIDVTGRECLRRQRQRGRVHPYVSSPPAPLSNLEAQDLFNEMCQEVCVTTDSETLRVQNTGPTSESVEQIQEVISQRRCQ